MDFILPIDLVIGLSIWLICISIIVILVSIFLIFNKKRTAEEKIASNILASVEALKQGKPLLKSESSHKSKENSFEIKKDESSLKSMLTKKFKPKIESQLNTKVDILDFNAKDNNFLALVEISGVKLLLILDSSGKIIDYKKVKKD